LQWKGAWHSGNPWQHPRQSATEACPDCSNGIVFFVSIRESEAEKAVTNCPVSETKAAKESAWYWA